MYKSLRQALTDVGCAIVRVDLWEASIGLAARGHAGLERRVLAE